MSLVDPRIQIIAEGARAEIERRAREREKGRKLYTLYPDEGPLRRELYAKHMEFFAAGAHHQEIAFIAANRCGKSLCICYEATCHMIGWYPDWWAGHRFNRPIVCWAAGEDGKAVRESLQPTLMGPPEAQGTGLVPAETIVRATARGGVPDAIDSAEIRHSSGGVSRLVFKAYEQGRESFQAAKIDIGLCDEEPPLAIYTELLTRTMSTVPGEPNGHVLCAFTPLRGVSQTVLRFLPGGAYPATLELRKQAWGF